MLLLQSRALAQASFDAACASALADLAVLLQCERISLGLRQGADCRVVAVSGVADLRQRQDAVCLLALAMQEALDQRCAVLHPLPPDTSRCTTLAHAALAHGNGGLAVCTLPILCAGQPAGALLFERRQGLDAAALQLAQDAALFIGPLLVLRQRADSGWRARLGAAAGHGGAALSPWRLGTLAAAVGLCVLAAWPTPHRVVAPVRVEGQAQRIIAAPVDGFVRTVAARPGEAVRAGQVLVQLEEQDLALEREKWDSELAKLDKQYRDALSKDDAGPIVIAASRLEEAQSQRALVQRRLQRTALTAPFDGVLISGDLSQSVGMPVQRGQELVTVASVGTWRIVAEVDEQDIAALRLGQRALVLFAALPQAVPFEVARIAAVATLADGRNVFEVEGSGAAAAALLRPGLRGVARIEIGPSHNAVLWWQRAQQWLRHTAWRLLG